MQAIKARKKDMCSNCQPYKRIKKKWEEGNSEDLAGKSGEGRETSPETSLPWSNPSHDQVMGSATLGVNQLAMRSLGIGIPIKKLLWRWLTWKVCLLKAVSSRLLDLLAHGGSLLSTLGTRKNFSISDPSS